MIVRFILVALIIFAGFRVFNFVAERINMLLRPRHNFIYLIPVLELLSWMVFIIWIAKVLYDSKSNLALVSIAVVFGLIAFPLFVLSRDFMTGIILKLQNKIVVGSYVNIEDIEGNVQSAGPLRMDIKDNHGTITSLRYNQVAGKRISRSGNNQNLEKVTMEFSFPATSNSNEIVANLKREVLNTPWIAISQTPIIENITNHDGKVTVKVGAFVLDKLYAEDVKNSVLSHLALIS